MAKSKNHTNHNQGECQIDLHLAHAYISYLSVNEALGVLVGST